MSRKLENRRPRRKLARQRKLKRRKRRKLTVSELSVNARFSSRRLSLKANASSTSSATPDLSIASIRS